MRTAVAASTLRFALSALRHTLYITLFIFGFTLALNLVIHGVGEDKLGVLLSDLPVLGNLLAALVGLIPNCAVSVLLTQLYLAGSVSFGSLLAGLCSGAGLGLAVLVKMNRSRRENFTITATLYTIAALCGLAVHLLL